MPRSNCDLTSRPIPPGAHGCRGLSKMRGKNGADSPATAANWLTRCMCPTKVSVREADSGRREEHSREFCNKGETHLYATTSQRPKRLQTGRPRWRDRQGQRVLFRCQSWAVRYLVADASGWLSGRLVLISPYALDPASKNDKVIAVDLTRKQIENSPSLDSDKPVSRRGEMQYYPYYGWPEYCGGPYLRGNATYPNRGQGGWYEATRHAKDDDPHLRSTKDVTGHRIEAGTERSATPRICH